MVVEHMSDMHGTASLFPQGRRGAAFGDECRQPTNKQDDEERLAAFGQAIDALRKEITLQLGNTDVDHIRRVGQLSSRLEVIGRGLLHFSFEPVTFSLGTVALWAHKCLELMEIGHMALHGAYDDLETAERFKSTDFYWKAPIDEAAWKHHHNVRHHQYTNIAGKDPDLDFGALRLSDRIGWRRAHLMQPVTNLLTWLGFTTGIGLHASGMLDVYLGSKNAEHERAPAEIAQVRKTFLSKWARYYGREYLFFPLLAGPFFPKVLLGNLISEVARDVYAAAVIYCGHVGADDFPAGTEPMNRAEWYAMQVESGRDVLVPEAISILCGALDLQIEHHLFPRLPPNRLREIAPRVREICAAHGINHRSDSWPRTLRSVLGELRRLSNRNPQPPVASAEQTAA